ncbi:MAG: hypothetical protein DWQ02_26055 [Bacteroidetes bacterium]|nr:MAG: hypothetical protein DWQ02_26055 [Bacteroidota bacterium]
MLFSCGEDELQRLEGHWHLTAIFQEDGSGRLYRTMNIYADTSGVFDKGYRGYDGRIGWVNLEKNEMHFGVECGSTSFSYMDWGEYLLLTGLPAPKNDGTIYIGEKIDSASCDKQFEFFNSVFMKIDLPVGEGIPFFDVDEPSLISFIKFGQNMFDVSNSVNMFLGDKKSEVSDLELWREKVLIKIPENRHDRVRYAIISNKDVEMRFIIPALTWFRENGEEKLYFASRNADSQSFELFLTPVVLGSLDFAEIENLTYEEVFKTID